MKTILFLLACLLGIQLNAQNLVVNGDFEYYTTCPTSLGQINKCIGWSQFTTGTSDYFSCTLVPNLGVNGYQSPASGVGFVGGLSSNSLALQTTGTTKEYIAGTLVAPMQVGLTYEVSISVNLGNISAFGTDDVGIFFYKNGPGFYHGWSIPPVTPQVTFSSYGSITDTVNWIRLIGHFYADSAYENIVIGCWKESAYGNRVPVNPTASFTYYNYDSVVVRLASKTSIDYSDNVAADKGWAIYPNPNNGTFTIQGKTTNTDVVKLVVANAIGQVVHTETLETGSNKPIQLGSHLPNGIYLLRIYAGAESLTVKITLQR